MTLLIKVKKNRKNKKQIHTKLKDKQTIINQLSLSSSPIFCNRA